MYCFCQEVILSSSRSENIADNNNIIIILTLDSEVACVTKETAIVVSAKRRAACLFAFVERKILIAHPRVRQVRITVRSTHAILRTIYTATGYNRRVTLHSRYHTNFAKQKL